jgi:phage tail tape-measure protein
MRHLVRGRLTAAELISPAAAYVLKNDYEGRSRMKPLVIKLVTAVIAVAMLVVVTGCSGQPLSTREKGTGIGALAGAATGAIIGAAVGAPGAGAAIGGALGAGGGFLVGNAMQSQQVKTQQTQTQIDSQQREIEHQRREIEQLKQQQEVE